MKFFPSIDDQLTESRLKLLAEFSETQFAAQFKLDCVSNAKNGKLSSALREKGNLSYAQGDCESALRLYNQVEYTASSRAKILRKNTYRYRRIVQTNRSHV